MDPTSYVNAVDSVPVSNLQVSEKYLNGVPHGNPSSSSIDPLSYGTYSIMLNI